MEAYRHLLGLVPRVAVINEMAWSGGILPHYAAAGYEAVLMEWNNPYRHHPGWDGELRFGKRAALGADGTVLPLLWVDTLPSQQFQRTVHRLVEEEDYLRYIREYRERAGDRFFCLYAGDGEVFDYRPRRYQDEPEVDTGGEGDAVGRLLDRLCEQEEIELRLPSELLDLPEPEPESPEPLRLESAAQPVPVKKQEKYTLNRWAVTGRDDFNINTACHRLAAAAGRNGELEGSFGKQLCRLWSSDFRTHIEEERWNDFRQELAVAEERFETVSPGRTEADGEPAAASRRDGRYLFLENRRFSCRLDTKRGLALLDWAPIGGERQNSDPAGWVGTIPHGRFDDIRYAADFYSCNMVIERPGAPKITDLSPCEPTVEPLPGGGVQAEVQVRCRDVLFRKTYSLPGGDGALRCRVRIEHPGRLAGRIRPMHLTFPPGAFDRCTLFFAAHNGGDRLERFELHDGPVDHADALSGIVSARYGFGATGGRVIVGDSSRQVEIVHDPGQAALIPSILYQPFDDGSCFLRLQYSAQELDETFVPGDRPTVIEAEFRLYSSTAPTGARAGLFTGGA